MKYNTETEKEQQWHEYNKYETNSRETDYNSNRVLWNDKNRVWLKQCQQQSIDGKQHQNHTGNRVSTNTTWQQKQEQLTKQTLHDNKKEEWHNINTNTNRRKMQGWQLHWKTKYWNTTSIQKRREICNRKKNDENDDRKKNDTWWQKEEGWHFSHPDSTQSTSYKNYFPVLQLQAAPIGSRQKVMQTMTTLMANCTTPQCQTIITSTHKASPIIQELTASKSGTRGLDPSIFLNPIILWEIPTRISLPIPTAVVIALDNNDPHPTQPHPQLSTNLDEKNIVSCSPNNKLIHCCCLPCHAINSVLQ